jgi:hypothetical protein
MAVFQPEQTAMSLSDLPSTTSIPRNKNGKIQLPANFIPNDSTVILGRIKACTTFIGNRRLKSIVNTFLKPYSEAKNKLEKTAIVSSIVGVIKRGGGTFVKCEDGVWWEVGEAIAREKVGSQLRDYLHTQYRSSTKAKLARRKAPNTMAQESTFYYHTYLHQRMNTSAITVKAVCVATDASSSTAEEIYCPSPSPSLPYQPMMQGTLAKEPTFYYDTCLDQGSYTNNDSQSSMLMNASLSTAEKIYCPSPSIPYQSMMQGTIAEESTLYYDTSLHQDMNASNRSQSSMLMDASSSTAEEIYCPSPSPPYQPRTQDTIAEESTFYYDTSLHQGSYASNEDSQSSVLTDASSSTAEEIYCPSPSIPYQPMMQGTIGQDAYMMPVKSTTNCVQDFSYDQQQPSKGTSEYCSLFSNYIDQQRNRKCRTDFLRGCMPTSTSTGIIGSARRTQETAGKQTMPALVQACSLFGEITEIDNEDDLSDDISGIFEEW